MTYFFLFYLVQVTFADFTSRLSAPINSNPLADNSTAEILIDNDDKEFVTITGDWIPNDDKNRSYGLNFLIDKSKGAKSVVIKYSPDVKVEGDYEIYLFMPKPYDGEAPTFTPINVFDGTTLTEKKVLQKDILIEGQTMGEWVNIGQFHFKKGNKAYVEISNKNADGSIVADAALFIPKN